LAEQFEHRRIGQRHELDGRGRLDRRRCWWRRRHGGGGGRVRQAVERVAPAGGGGGAVAGPVVRGGGGPFGRRGVWLEAGGAVRPAPRQTHSPVRRRGALRRRG